MQISLLKAGYKNSEAFYEAFLEDRLRDSEFLSEEFVWLENPLPDFPIYFAGRNAEERERQFLYTIQVIDQHVLPLERDLFMDECFWHSWLCLYKRAYLLKQYPQIQEGYEKFKTILLKDFNWENYIYKAILIAQYVNENKPESARAAMYHTILQNMDVFNYIIKYEIFRNGPFLINVMDIIEEEQLSKLLKARIKNRPDLASDERYGRRVIFELNKSYPILLAPMLDKDSLKPHFMKFLSYYYDSSCEDAGFGSEEESEDF